MLQTPVRFSFYLHDSAAQMAHMPELLHRGLASWSLQEQKIPQFVGVLTALETPGHLTT